MGVYISYKDLIVNKLGFSSYVARNFVINDDKNVPWLCRNITVHRKTNDINTWYLTLENAEILKHKVKVIPDYQKELFCQSEENVMDDIYREKLHTFAKSNLLQRTMFIGWIERYGYQKYTFEDQFSTVLIQSLFDFKLGNKLADHIWIKIIPDLFPNNELIKPHQYVTFSAQRIKYHKDDHKFAVSLGYTNGWKVIPMEELRQWKCDMLAKRKQSK